MINCQFDPYSGACSPIGSEGVFEKGFTFFVPISLPFFNSELFCGKQIEVPLNEYF